MENNSVFERDQQQNISSTSPGTIESPDKDRIVNSEDQQKPVNTSGDEEPSENLVFEKDIENTPLESPSNDTDDSEQTKQKIPNA